MQNNWQVIWNKKQLDISVEPTLEQLISIDGFDSPFSGINQAQSWIEYVESIAKKLQISANDSIFEVGCGAGAFLYPFYTRGNRIAGIDYSHSLVKVAKDVMPNANISTSEAIDIPTNQQFDIVLSNGVFLYFPNYEYAQNVIQNMVSIATKAVGIFDLPDLAKKEETINYRKSVIGESEYEQKYKGLDHLYFSKDWFKQILANELVDIFIEDQNIINYGNSQYRFNVLIYKK